LCALFAWSNGYFRDLKKKDNMFEPYRCMSN